MQFPGEQPGGTTSHTESGHVTVFPLIVQPAESSSGPPMAIICAAVGPDIVMVPLVM
jgi:hypothetical protein